MFAAALILSISWFFRMRLINLTPILKEEMYILLYDLQYYVVRQLQSNGCCLWVQILDRLFRL